MDKELIGYRRDCIRISQKLNEKYDKLIITLASGSLALSLAFLKDVIKLEEVLCPMLLMGAWLLFILSLTSVLFAILFGIKANEKAVKQIDDDKIYDETPGGVFSIMTTWSHYMGTVFLIAGFIFLTSFVYCNMEGKDAKKTTATQATKTISVRANTQTTTTMQEGQRMGATATAPTDKGWR